MFKIDRTAGKDRLVADAVLTPLDFQRIAEVLGRPPLRARKDGFVAARRAERSEVVETRWNGKVTSNTARPGDFIVTNLSAQRQPLRDGEGQMNVYVIAAERFADLYEPAGEHGEHGAAYRVKGALLFSGGLDIAAPWGSRQSLTAGYLLYSDAGVYGCSLPDDGDPIELGEVGDGGDEVARLEAQVAHQGHEPHRPAAAVEVAEDVARLARGVGGVHGVVGHGCSLRRPGRAGITSGCDPMGVGRVRLPLTPALSP